MTVKINLGLYTLGAIVAVALRAPHEGIYLLTYIIQGQQKVGRPETETVTSLEGNSYLWALRGLSAVSSFRRIWLQQNPERQGFLCNLD